MISEIDLRDMKDLIDHIDSEALENGRDSPFSCSEYFKLMDIFDELIKERQSKIARLFLPLTKWV